MPVFRPIATAVLAILGLVSAAAAPARAQAVNELPAKAEGALAFYVGGPTAPWEATAQVFEQRYPGIKVSITGGFSTCSTRRSMHSSRPASSRSTSRCSRP